MDSYQLKSFANFLILFAVVGLAFIFGPLLGVEARYTFKTMTAATFDLSAVPEAEFSLLIPKIWAKTKVYKNINPGNYDDYIKVLRQGVAHAAGTGLPGGQNPTSSRQGGTSLGAKNIFLFAHSSIFPWEAGRVNPVFYLLNKLENGDMVYLYYQGKRYDYSVIDKKIVDTREVREINNPGNEGLLILQTCWPPGTTFKRLLVIATPC